MTKQVEKLTGYSTYLRKIKDEKSEVVLRKGDEKLMPIKNLVTQAAKLEVEAARYERLKVSELKIQVLDFQGCHWT